MMNCLRSCEILRNWTVVSDMFILMMCVTNGPEYIMDPSALITNRQPAYARVGCLRIPLATTSMTC